MRLSAKMFHCQSTILRRPAVNTKGNNRTGPAWSGTSAEYNTSTYEYGVSLHQYLSSSSNALKHGRMLSNAHIAMSIVSHSSLYSKVCLEILQKILTQLPSLLAIVVRFGSKQTSVGRSNLNRSWSPHLRQEDFQSIE